METIELGKVLIPGMIATSKPSRSKIENRIGLVQSGRYRPITLDRYGVLLDGYTTLLAAALCGESSIKYVTDQTKVRNCSVYTFGKLVWFKEPHKAIDMVAVQDLNSGSGAKTKYVTEVLQQMFDSQNGKCYICGRELDLTGCGKNMATIDHVHPKSLGGTNEQSNLMLSCLHCNQLKGAFIFSNELKELIIRQREIEDTYDKTGCL